MASEQRSLVLICGCHLFFAVICDCHSSFGKWLSNEKRPKQAFLELKMKISFKGKKKYALETQNSDLSFGVCFVPSQTRDTLLEVAAYVISHQENVKKNFIFHSL
jgi:hypothetical protein